MEVDPAAGPPAEGLQSPLRVLHREAILRALVLSLAQSKCDSLVEMDEQSCGQARPQVQAIVNQCLDSQADEEASNHHRLQDYLQQV